MELYAQIAELAAEGLPFVVATVIESGGSTPQKPGSKMVVLPDGTVRGTVGGGQSRSRSSMPRSSSSSHLIRLE